MNVGIIQSVTFCDDNIFIVSSMHDKPLQVYAHQTYHIICIRLYITEKRDNTCAYQSYRK